MRHTVLHYTCLNEVGIHIFVCMCVCLHVCMGRHMYTCMCAYACRIHGLTVDILFSYSTFTCSDRSNTTSEAHWISKARWPLSPRISLSHLSSTGISALLYQALYVGAGIWTQMVTIAFVLFSKPFTYWPFSTAGTSLPTPLFFLWI